MSALWTASDIAAATNGMASADFAVNGIAFDSREIGTGDLFSFGNVETVPSRQKVISLPIRSRAVIGVVDSHFTHADHV